MGRREALDDVRRTLAGHLTAAREARERADCHRMIAVLVVAWVVLGGLFAASLVAG